MPFLHLSTLPALPATTRDALAAGLTQALSDVLGKRHAVSAVLIDTPADAGWYIGGVPVGPGALTALHAVVYITAGTNTPAEKTAFITAVHAALDAAGVQRPEASYCIVQELPAGDWGYNGITQAARAAQRALAGAG